MSHVIHYKGGAQNLLFTPPDRVTSCEYEINDFEIYNVSDTANYQIASGSATLDSVSVGVDVLSGRGSVNDKKISVDSLTGIAKDQILYISDSTTGFFETFEVEYKGDDEVYAKTPLLNQYTSGSVVQGITFTALFPSSQANDRTLFENRENFRVVWKYDLNSRRHQVQELIRLVRNNEADWTNIEEIYREVKEIYDSGGTAVDDPGGFKKIIKRAIADIKTDLLGVCEKPEEVLYGEQGITLSVYKSLFLLSLFGRPPKNIDDLESYRSELKIQHEKILNQLRKGNKTVDVANVDKINDKSEPTKRIPLIGRL